MSKWPDKARAREGDKIVARAASARSEGSKSPLGGLDLFPCCFLYFMLSTMLLLTHSFLFSFPFYIRLEVKAYGQLGSTHDSCSRHSQLEGK